MKSEIVNLNHVQNKSNENLTAQDLLSMHPIPWERRGRAIFDSKGNRINLVDPLTLTGVIDLVEQFSNS